MICMNAAIAGAGFIGEQHLQAIRRIPGTQVVAVFDTDPAIAKSVADRHALPHFYTNMEDMLADPQIQVVHNCTPNAFHYAINEAAIAAKKHIYCEKPLCFTSKEARQLAHQAVKAGVAAAVNFNYRHNVLVKEMKQRIQESAGRVFSVRCDYLQDWLMFDTDYSWRMDPKVGGPSRALADIGSHCFDLVQYVTGQRITDVYAQLMTVHPQRKKVGFGGATFGANAPSKGQAETVEVSTEDAAFIIAHLEDGTPVLFNLSQVWGGKKNGLSIGISAEKYAMEWQQEQADRLWVGHRNKANEELYADARLLSEQAGAYATLPAGHAVGWHDALQNAIAAFYECIANGYNSHSQACVDFATAGQIIDLVEACMESGKTQRKIML